MRDSAGVTPASLNIVPTGGYVPRPPRSIRDVGDVCRAALTEPGDRSKVLRDLRVANTPQVVTDAWDYFNTVQTKTVKYRSFFAPTDKPPIWLNESIMARYRPEMRKHYYDPTKYGTYLEQLGITYPTVRQIVQ